MKTVCVAAAVIRDGDRVFAAQRAGGGWEFPGGKIEPGESPQQALIREIREELDLGIAVGGSLAVLEYDYPAFHLSMQCFWCRITEGTPVLKEHADARWLGAEDLDSVDWLPADRALIGQVRAALSGLG
ncbi:MAG: (deoxy)nucleoside triphosphate pyrophosphohydrolase [Oscillospiraceae bacterium]|jgi:8-oxo-dGTP diphosphatase|nr:(deoxy)nucleoside triphosphate pyrophosphohydrolase [Oscillospiraceae bacterium]